MALEMPLVEFSVLSVDDQVAKLDEWLCYVNDTLLGRQRRPRLGKVRKAAYSAELRRYKDAIVKVKEDEWRGFVRDNRDDPWGRVYKICRGRGKRLDVESLSVGGVLLCSWRDCVEALMTNFFPGSGDQLPSVLLRDTVPPALERDGVIESVCRVRCRRSPGMDAAWKTARVIVLLKSPDKVRSNPGSYRGISLLIVLSKVLDRIMVSRLERLKGASISE